MMFPGFADGVRNIWETDRATQEFYLRELGATRSLPVDAFEKFDAFFVPNDGYVRRFFGPECQNFLYEIYRSDGSCTMNNCIVFPFYSLLNQVVGWVNYKPFVRMKAAEENNWDTGYYEYPSSLVFSKGKYVFTLPKVFERAMRDGYIVVTDGVFDTVSFVHYGVNSCSVLGSQFSTALAFYCQFVDRIFVSIDNDAAGDKLFAAVKKLLPRARQLRQTIGKDADDALKSDLRGVFLDAVREGIRRDADVIFRQPVSYGNTLG